MTIFEAIRAYDLKTVQRLLKKDPLLARGNPADFQTPLHYALYLLPTWTQQDAMLCEAHQDRKETYQRIRLAADDIISLLVPLSDLNAVDGQGETALHVAIRRRLIEWVPSLLQAGANPNIENNQGKSPFSLSTEMHFCHLLLEYGAHLPKDVANPDLYLRYAVEKGLERSVVSILENHSQVISNGIIRELILTAPTNAPSIIALLSSVLKTRPSLLKIVQSGNIPAVTKLLDEYPGITLWDDGLVQPFTVFEASILAKNNALLTCLVQHYTEHFLPLIQENYLLYYPDLVYLLANLLELSITQGTLPIFTHLFNYTNVFKVAIESLFFIALDTDNTEVMLFLIEAYRDDYYLIRRMLEHILSNNKTTLVQQSINRYILFPKDFINPDMAFMPLPCAILFKQAFLSTLQKKAFLRMCHLSDDAFFEQESELVCQIADIAVQEFLKETVSQYGPWQLKKFSTLNNLPLDPNSVIAVEENSEETENLPLYTDEQYSQLIICASPDTLQSLYDGFYNGSISVTGNPGTKKTYIFHRKHPTHNTKHLICFEATSTSFTCFIPTSRVPCLMTTEDCLKATRAAYSQAWVWHEEAKAERLEACKRSFEHTLWQKGMFWVFPTQTNMLQDKRVALCQKTYHEALEHDTEQLFPKRPLALTWRP
jgi:ankyrin repeat protein